MIPSSAPTAGDSFFSVDRSADSTRLAGIRFDGSSLPLEEALIDFPGCAVVISHDRWFLDRIATHILAFEGGSRVVWFEGNYDDYEKDWKRRLGPEADQPHRVKYKPLTKS